MPGKTFDFNAIQYRQPRISKTSRHITNLVGFDSEAYLSGEPFMFCTSRHHVWTLADLPSVFFSRDYRNTNFLTWNLKYESGAILYALPAGAKRELWKFQEVERGGYRYKYFPHKMLRIYKGRKSVTFWDMGKFYQSSLAVAAKHELGVEKDVQEYEKYTPEYVKAHWLEIRKACIGDADKTLQLGNRFLGRMANFGIHPSSLYSLASLSYTYFKQQGEIVDVWKLWKNWPELLQFACKAYAGGKFEVQGRGTFEGYEFDLDSAYPSEMAKLVDFRDYNLRITTEYISQALYAFLHVEVFVGKDLAHPLPIKLGALNTYPIGKFKTYVTKAEYDYMTRLDVEIRILAGYWIIPRGDSTPYADTVRDLWRLKSDKKDTPDHIRKAAKKLLNSFYGKMVQLTPLPNGKLRAGPAWNPIFGAVITANVRIRMCEAQNFLGRDCLAVHTDSVISTRPLPKSWIKPGMGNYKLEKVGRGTIIASGLYEIADKVADRGFPVTSDFRWGPVLKKMGNRSTMAIPYTQVMSWIAGAARGDMEEVNRFVAAHKTLDVNCDLKRAWDRPTTGKRLLAGLEYSNAVVKVGV